MASGKVVGGAILYNEQSLVYVIRRKSVGKAIPVRTAIRFGERLVLFCLVRNIILFSLFSKQSSKGEAMNIACQWVVAAGKAISSYKRVPPLILENRMERLFKNMLKYFA